MRIELIIKGSAQMGEEQKSATSTQKINQLREKSKHYRFKLRHHGRECEWENGKESKSILSRVFPDLADAAAAAALSAYVERHFTSFRSIHYSAALSASLTHFAPWLRNQFYLLFLLLFLLLAAAPPSYTFAVDVVFPMRSCSTCNSIQ